MTIEELYKDKNFLVGLRKGEYCLVLGAGFSVRLKNMTNLESLSIIDTISYDDFRHIPLVPNYISLTNEIFGETTTKGESAANIWECNNFSIIKGDEIVDLKSFYRDLFTLDEDWFRENELNYYKSILLPNWYQVYTFNFDNVFETIIKLQAKDDFYTLHFPENKGDNNRRTLKKAIHHLHGYILQTPPEELTFSQNTYRKLEKATHTLYDPFHVDIDSGKKLVIIGNQFDERNIDRLFFDGLTNKNITIYHFSKDNSDFKTKPGIIGNPNYHFIKINDIHEVLSFFENLKNQIENIKIAGADVINSDFIEKVKQEGIKENFTPSDFYLAKQVDVCQWFGVIQNWAVERDNYNFIKQETISSLSKEKRNSKISALLWGLGGSGKSTLLRQLSVDLSNEDFAVLWIKDKSIQNFYYNGLSQIRIEYPHKRFLVVIEDLYRVKQQDVNLKEIINSICSNSNVRLIVGDRKNDDNTYKEHIFNPDKNIIELTVYDNKNTLTKILKNIPDWKSTAERLLKTDNDYKSTLYYILWTIGRTAQKEKEGFSLNNYQDLTSHFRSLVQSDLKALSVNYPGVGKMLYYWASIYAKNKIYIAYDLFFTLADLFKASAINDSKLIHASPANKVILDIYTHKSTGYIRGAGELPLFAFNHDILAEDGLSKSQLSGWHPFDDSIKLSMLPIVSQTGDAFSASSFLSNCLIYIPDLVFSKDEKKKYVSILWEKGNMNKYLASAFNRNYFTDRENAAKKILKDTNLTALKPEIVVAAFKYSIDAFIKENAAKKILEDSNLTALHHDIVVAAFKYSIDASIKENAAKKILKDSNLTALIHHIIVAAFKHCKDAYIKENAAKKILKDGNLTALIHHIIVAAFKYSKDAYIKENAAKKILKDSNLTALHHDIVVAAFTHCKDLYIEKNAAKKILEDSNLMALQHDIVVAAFTHCKDASIEKNAAKKILKDSNLTSLKPEIVVAAFRYSIDAFIKENAAKKILKDSNLTSLKPEIVVAAFRYSIDAFIKENAAKKILKDSNLTSLIHHTIIVAAFKHCKDAYIKENAAKKILEDSWKQKGHVIFSALFQFAERENIPWFCEEIIRSIIKEKFDRTSREKGKYFRYKNLMLIPFHQVVIWKNTSLENIKNYTNKPRDLITNTILAYRSKPQEIIQMCKNILENWQLELSIPIYVPGLKNEPHFGDHILLSLGHPDLKQLAEQTALKIKETESYSPGYIPEHLLNVVNQIIDEKSYPIWNSKNNTEQE